MVADLANRGRSMNSFGLMRHDQIAYNQAQATHPPKREKPFSARAFWALDSAL
jgi:hypothetical protein